MVVVKDLDVQIFDANFISDSIGCLLMQLNLFEDVANIKSYEFCVELKKEFAKKVVRDTYLLFG